MSGSINEQMPLRRLGQTEMMVSCIGFGGLGIMERYMRRHTSNTDLDAACEIINLALNRGLNFIDTARSYGESEPRIGEVMKYRRQDCYLASKTMKRDALGAARHIDESLKALQTHVIDLYQLHHIQWECELGKVLERGGALDGLKQAKKEGKIRYIGITGHRPEILIEAINTGEFDTVQLPYNIFDRELFQDILPAAIKMDLGTIISKPLAIGHVEQPHDVEIALRSVLSCEISTTIPGMCIPEHAEFNTKVGRMFKPLSSIEKDELLREAERLREGFCRQCGKCIPHCPANLNIPYIFRLMGYKEVYKSGHWAKKQYQYLESKANECTNCRACEEHCPYNVAIREMLVRGHEILTGEITPREYRYHGLEPEDIPDWFKEDFYEAGARSQGV